MGTFGGRGTNQPRICLDLGWPGTQYDLLLSKLRRARLGADVFEEVEIISTSDGICYANTSDNIPKTIDNCDLEPGTIVTIKYGEGLAWATISE